MTSTACTEKATNSMRIELSGMGLTAGSVFQELERFGELSRLDILPDLEPAVIVSFFDVRCAKRAKACLGDLCCYEPQHGERSLRLRGQAGLDSALIAQVSNITRVEGSEGDYWVEFFDTRVVAKVAAMLESDHPCQDGDATKPLSELIGSRPKKVHDLRLTELRWQDISHNLEWRTALHLRGLPRVLCDESAIEALLKAHSLLDAVERIRVQPVRGIKQLGCAVLTAKSVSEVSKLAKFFHGRRFGPSPPVAVSFAPLRRSLDLRPLPRAARSPQTAGGAAEEPRYVRSGSEDAQQQVRRLTASLLDLPSPVKVGDAGSDDASTSGGSPRASSGGDVSPEDARKSVTLSSLPGLRPPPGLECLLNQC